MTKIRNWVNMFFMTGFLFIAAYSQLSYAGQRCCKPCCKTSAQQVDGATLWANTCSKCHNFRNMDEFRPDQWHTIMAHMRVRALLTKQEARQILAFLTKGASLNRLTTPVPLTKTNHVATRNHNVRHKTKVALAKKQSISGGAIYRNDCAACHGPNGKGAIPGAPDFRKPGGVLAQPYGVILNNIENGIGSMPPKGGNPNLSLAELKAVLNYILSRFK